MRTSSSFLMQSLVTGAAAGAYASARKTVMPTWINASHVNSGITPRPLDPQGGSTG
ncbi:MAG: hypothetical protein NVSMB12_18450 [Acidimicrobiales bacterium]